MPTTASRAEPGRGARSDTGTSTDTSDSSRLDRSLTCNAFPPVPPRSAARKRLSRPVIETYHRHSALAADASTFSGPASSTAITLIDPDIIECEADGKGRRPSSSNTAKSSLSSRRSNEAVQIQDQLPVLHRHRDEQAAKQDENKINNNNKHHQQAPPSSAAAAVALTESKPVRLAKRKSLLARRAVIQLLEDSKILSKDTSAKAEKEHANAVVVEQTDGVASQTASVATTPASEVIRATASNAGTPVTEKAIREQPPPPKKDLKSKASLPIFGNVGRREMETETVSAPSTTSKAKKHLSVPIVEQALLAPSSASTRDGGPSQPGSPKKPRPLSTLRPKASSSFRKFSFTSLLRGKKSSTSLKPSASSADLSSSVTAAVTAAAAASSGRKRGTTQVSTREDDPCTAATAAAALAAVAYDQMHAIATGMVQTPGASPAETAVAAALSGVSGHDLVVSASPSMAESGDAGRACAKLEIPPRDASHGLPMSSSSSRTVAATPAAAESTDEAKTVVTKDGAAASAADGGADKADTTTIQKQGKTKPSSAPTVDDVNKAGQKLDATKSEEKQPATSSPSPRPSVPSPTVPEIKVGKPPPGFRITPGPAPPPRPVAAPIPPPPPSPSSQQVGADAEAEKDNEDEKGKDAKTASRSTDEERAAEEAAAKGDVSTPPLPTRRDEAPRSSSEEGSAICSGVLFEAEGEGRGAAAAVAAGVVKPTVPPTEQSTKLAPTDANGGVEEEEGGAHEDPVDDYLLWTEGLDEMPLCTVKVVHKRRAGGEEEKALQIKEGRSAAEGGEGSTLRDTEIGEVGKPSTSPSSPSPPPPPAAGEGRRHPSSSTGAKGTRHPSTVAGTTSPPSRRSRNAPPSTHDPIPFPTVVDPSPSQVPEASTITSTSSSSPAATTRSEGGGTKRPSLHPSPPPQPQPQPQPQPPAKVVVRYTPAQLREESGLEDLGDLDWCIGGWM